MVYGHDACARVRACGRGREGEGGGGGGGGRVFVGVSCGCVCVFVIWVTTRRFSLSLKTKMKSWVLSFQAVSSCTGTENLSELTADPGGSVFQVKLISWKLLHVYIYIYMCHSLKQGRGSLPFNLSNEICKAFYFNCHLSAKVQILVKHWPRSTD